MLTGCEYSNIVYLHIIVMVHGGLLGTQDVRIHNYDSKHNESHH